MPGFGIGELVLIFLIVVLIFGATRLPQLGKGLGEGIANFKTGLKSKEEKDETDEEKPS
ncbi:MAG: twin-arginine translocase TatA/TatE family subunit [Thermoanaerobaculia bacterium]|nr:twin-arginine translocase TatA/TatE family subunit [Thermoanaerobaculia bacterium]